MSCDQSPGLFINTLIPTVYRSMFPIKFDFDWPSGFREVDL